MISLSFIDVIIITAYVACLCSTNRKANRYKSPTLKLKKSSKLKQSEAITINHTGGLIRQKSTETVNTLLEIIKRTLESGEDELQSKDVESNWMSLGCGVQYAKKTGCR